MSVRREHQCRRDRPRRAAAAACSTSAQGERAGRGARFKALRDPGGEPAVGVGSLSGGNQQKVLLSRWLETEPEGADPRRADPRRRHRRQVGDLPDHRRARAERASACIVISSELPEIIGICDRVLVMREGAHRGRGRRPQRHADHAGEHHGARHRRRGLSARSERRSEIGRTKCHERDDRRSAAKRGFPAAPRLSAAARCRSAASIQAVGMLPVLILLCIGFQYLSDRPVLQPAEHLDRRAAGLDQHRAGGRHDLRHPDRRHRPVGRLGPGGLGRWPRVIAVARSRAGACSASRRRCSPAWCFGLLNGALIAFFRLPPFIVTLGSLTAVRGIARLIGNDTTVFNPHLPFAFIGNGQHASACPGSSIIALLVVVVSLVHPAPHRAGRADLRASAATRTAARLSGIKVWADPAVRLLRVGPARRARRRHVGRPRSSRPTALQLGQALRARRDRGGHPGRHQLRRRHRLDLGHAGRRADHRRAVQRPRSCSASPTSGSSSSRAW